MSVASAGNECLLVSDFNPDCFHCSFYAGHQFLYDLVLAGHYFGEIGGGSFHIDSVFISMQSIIVHLRAVEQRFCRNTTFVEAHTAKRVLFEKYYA